jgi:hypothetical protein
LRVHNVQNGKRIDEERLTIDAPGPDLATTAKWTITIDNGDDAPLTLKSVRLQMLERTLCFEAEGNTRYTLFYGDPALTAPHYDYATLFTSLALSDGGTGTARSDLSRILLEFPSDLSTHRSRRSPRKNRIVLESFSA